MRGMVIIAIIAVITVPLMSHSFAYQTEIGDDVFVFVQSTLRDSNGAIVAYLESTKFSHINHDSLDAFLDYEASLGDDPILEIDGEQYEVIRRTQSKIFDETSLVASTVLSDSVGGNITPLVRFAHDGYPTASGDTLETIWTFLRPVL